jgi:hypothetical protein
MAAAVNNYQRSQSGVDSLLRLAAKRYAQSRSPDVEEEDHKLNKLPADLVGQVESEVAAHRLGTHTVTGKRDQQSCDINLSTTDLRRDRRE